MSSTKKSLVFVTGATGFLGAQIVHHLLEDGYPVRAAARGAKLELLKKAFKKYEQFEVVEVPDIASSDLSLALSGVGAIIHAASPLPGHASPESAMKTAVDGTLHVFRAAVDAGISRVVLTGSIVSWAPQGPFGSDDWNTITREEALGSDRYVTYFATKKFAEQAAFAFAEEHPSLDLTVLAPAFIFGPFAPGFEELIPAPEFPAFSTNGFMYALLRPENEFFPGSPGYVDVRDVAKLHVLALNSQPSSVVGRKRFITISPHAASYKAAIEFIAAERPGLKGRLGDPHKALVHPNLDAEREGLERAVGFGAKDYHSWSDTVLDAIDSLVQIENGWKAKGFQFEMPTSSPL